MKFLVFRMAQQGGEYYGYIRITTNSKNYEIKDGTKLVLDDSTIEFGELLEFVSAEDIL